MTLQIILISILKFVIYLENQTVYMKLVPNIRLHVKILTKCTPEFNEQVHRSDRIKQETEWLCSVAALWQSRMWRENVVN